MPTPYWGSYRPGSSDPYKISRSKVELFNNCPRCFWLDRRKKVGRVQGPPFQINKAVDELLKNEFDSYRQKGQPHPWMEEYNIDAIPFEHKDLDRWRHNFTGVQRLHEPTNLLLYGAIDDVWQAPDETLIVADYKATAKKSEVSLDADWQIVYKRQMEFYQWLLRGNGFDVSDTAWFVYSNGIPDNPDFKNKVEFRTKLIAYEGDDSWIEPTLKKIKDTLDSDELPDRTPDCEWCDYVEHRVGNAVKMAKTKKDQTTLL
ncbi:MAG: PD-(D/E)XK nuclease family protein [Candidatus Saccharimonadales bacterium]|nr:PD-(D/E)XK nuclease family protein [Candidatus Saccharimonadales bacterium]